MYDRSTIYPLILERMKNGESLRQICRDDGMPTDSVVHLWLNDDAAFSEQYTRAGEGRGDYFVDKAVEVIQLRPEMVDGDTNHKAGASRMDSACVAWQKAQADTYLKVAALVAPKKYGAKVDMTHAGPNGGPMELNVTKIERVIVDPPA